MKVLKLGLWPKEEWCWGLWGWNRCGAGLPKLNLAPRKELKGEWWPPNLWATERPRKSAAHSNSLILRTVGATVGAG